MAGQTQYTAMQSSGASAILGDTREEIALDQRRQREAERLVRIKDPALQGKVDCGALDAQIAEKNASKSAAKERETMYDNERLFVDQQLVYLEQERLRHERQKLKNVEDFRQTKQGKELGRDYDLNDPNALRVDLPGRVNDDDSRLSVSGLQQFHGEDLNHGHRIKQQREEIRKWSDEMADAKSAAKQREKEEEMSYANSMLQIDQMKVQLEQTAKDARSNTVASLAEYNLAQAAAKRERERALQISELQSNVEEIQANLAGATLTEDPSVGRSYIAANRLRPDHYKGMSDAEHQNILLEQEAQRRYNEEAKLNEKMEKTEGDAQLEYLRQVRCLTETQVADKRATMRRALMEDNKELANQQMSQSAFLETQVYPNAVDDAFFSQFNTTSR